MHSLICSFLKLTFHIFSFTSSMVHHDHKYAYLHDLINIRHLAEFSESGLIFQIFVAKFAFSMIALGSH